ncbi:MAG TPA: hypothetical protein VJW73_02750 [Gemmatimonadaceae bacterium]|nr:hypothetical protein [Gemmatimonadaceae bacterium]
MTIPKASDLSHPTNASSAREPRIAVIAVHGVADQKPGETAAAVAGLLLSLDPSKRADNDPHRHDPLKSAPLGAPAGSYAGFEESFCRMPLRPLSVKEVETPMRRSISFDERRGYIASLRTSRSGNTEPSAEERDRVSLEYLREQLSDYRGSDATASYETVRLEGRRSGATGPLSDASATEHRAARGDPAKSRDSIVVHVYEMYWADLSRLGSGPVKFFSALYQLLGHLAALGRQAIDAARAEQPSRGWSALQWLHSWVIRLLVLFVPVLNFVLLVTGLSVVPAERIDPRFARGVAVAFAALLGIAVAYRLLRSRTPPRKPFTWALAPLIASLTAGGVVGVIVERVVTLRLASSTSLLILEWWVVAGAVTWFAMRLYARVRPGAVVVGMSAFAFALGIYFVYTLVSYGDQRAHQAETTALWTMQAVFILLAATWRILFGFGWLALVIGSWCALRDRAGNSLGRFARTRAALRTAQLTVAVTAGAYLFTVIILWSGIFRFTIERFGVFACVPASTAPGLSWVQWLMPTPAEIMHWLPAARLAPPEPCIAAGLTARQYFAGLIASSVTTGIAPVLFLQTAALFLLIWMALPSVQSEVDAPSKCTNADSLRQGQWLSRGLDTTGYVTWLLWLSTFLVIPAFALVDWWHRRAGVQSGLMPDEATLSWFAEVTLFFIQSTGGLFAASAIVLLTAVAKFGGSALDLVLDVDNYLSTGPIEATPTARILERYASLFRYLSNYSEAGRGYDACVIVAHSLGTTITADILRVLHRQACGEDGDRLAATTLGPLDSELRGIFGRTAAKGKTSENRVPIYLFTMGSPLRQLMNRFFPHRFWWVRDEPDNGRAPLQDAPPKLPRGEVTGRDPSPAKLGVAQWSNAYRSGDYVGRGVWLDEWYQRTNGKAESGGYPEPITFSADETRWEACIGLGAHTHYWDGTAPDIAMRLDELIVMAASAARSRA